jgi:hypothetical protein
MADEIKVNATEWNSLPKDDQKKIQTLLEYTGFLNGRMNITPDPTVRASAAGLGGVGAQPAGFCKIGCDIGEATAVAACAVLSGPAAPVCIAAAHAAAEICRKQC